MTYWDRANSEGKAYYHEVKSFTKKTSEDTSQKERTIGVAE